MKDKNEGFVIMGEYKGKGRRLTAEEAIDAILLADGIPVLAHGIFEDGAGLLSESEIDARVKRLKALGLMGLECYYSSYTKAQSDLMLSLADVKKLTETR